MKSTNSQISKFQFNAVEKQLYDLLSDYVPIMEKAKKDYKPYTPRTIDEQAGRLYIAAYRTRYGYPPVLHGWGCQVCCLKNWRAFADWYDTMAARIGTQNEKQSKNQNKSKK